MYLYKLPLENQYIFTKERSLYNLYQPKELSEQLLIPEKIYQKYQKHFGKIESIHFRNSALETLKEFFKTNFVSNHFSSVQKYILSFLINQFKITKEQYEEILQKSIQEEYSFDLQVQMAKYHSIKKQQSVSAFQRLINIFSF